MNSPLLLTSFALLAGVAARPIDNNRQRDDLRELYVKEAFYLTS